MENKMNITFPSHFRESYVETKNNFLKELPIKTSIEEELDVHITGSIISIFPKKNSVEYEGFQNIKNHEINANSKFVELKELGSIDKYFFHYNKKE